MTFDRCRNVGIGDLRLLFLTIRDQTKRKSFKPIGLNTLVLNTLARCIQDPQAQPAPAETKK